MTIRIKVGPLWTNEHTGQQADMSHQELQATSVSRSRPQHKLSLPDFSEPNLRDYFTELEKENTHP